jgi:hypothetical protein
MRSKLADVVVRVFEQTAFMTPEIVDIETAQEWPSTPCLLVSVEYHGPSEGIISLVIPPEPSQELTANFLGEDAEGGELTKDHIDAVKEVANIVVGQFLPEYYGPEAVFQLSPPEAELLEAEQLGAKFNKEDFMRLDIEGDPLLATLTRGKDVHEHQSIGS